MLTTPPCHHCNERTAKCHIDCKAYKFYRLELDQEAKQRRGQAEYTSYRMDSKMKRDRYDRNHSLKG